jgi:hypothetical protein
VPHRPGRRAGMQKIFGIVACFQSMF